MHYFDVISQTLRALLSVYESVFIIKHQKQEKDKFKHTGSDCERIFCLHFSLKLNHTQRLSLAGIFTSPAWTDSLDSSRMIAKKNSKRQMFFFPICSPLFIIKFPWIFSETGFKCVIIIKGKTALKIFCLFKSVLSFIVAFFIEKVWTSWQRLNSKC